MSVNNFKPRKFEDFEIVDIDGKAAGGIRVKPSGILWAPKDAKVWYGVNLAKFSKWMEKNGRRQKK
jgi:hypothetical protein